MSRIEEALKRASVERQPDDSRRDQERAEPRAHDSVDTPVVAAWQLDRLPSEGAAPSSESAPEAAVPTETATAKSEAGQSFEVRANMPERSAIAAHMAERLVTMSADSPISTEQYRKLAGSLHQAQIERNIKVVMVASAMPGEGKTFTALNLALTLSQSYRRRVLLVDADLRRPQMHELFHLPAVSGLTEGLKAETPGRLSVFEVSPRLVLLPAGRPDPDPMGILTSERMRHVIEEASAAFDWVILDTPPVVLLPDANLLADTVDVSVLVLAAGKTPYRMVSRAVEILGKDRILGVVLNGATEDVVAAASGYSVDDRYASPYAVGQVR